MMITLRLLPKWIWPAIAIFIPIYAVFMLRLDPDFGWHVQSGHYILAHGIPLHDVFSYTAKDFPWINGEWLSDVLIAGLYAVTGFCGVAAFFALLWTAALMVASRYLQWPVLAIGTAAIADIITARPSAWTAFGMALMIWALRNKVYWPLTLGFALWANLHDGFVIGFVVLAVAAITDAKYWRVLIGCIVASFLNPYGPRIYAEIWRTVSDTQLRSSVVEWRPLTLTVFGGLYLFIYLTSVITRGWRRQEFWLPTLLLAAAVSSTRNFPLFVIGSLEAVEGAYMRLSSSYDLSKRWRRAIMWLAASGLLLYPVLQVALHPDSQEPTAQVALLAAQPCKCNLFNDYDFGGYLIWKLPQTKIYIDGRMPSWRYHGQYYLGDWARDLTDEVARRADFEHYQIRCALVRSKRVVLIRQLIHEGWIVNSADSEAILLRKPS
jgi:hypothetical protein